MTAFKSLNPTRQGSSVFSRLFAMASKGRLFLAPHEIFRSHEAFLTSDFVSVWPDGERRGASAVLVFVGVFSDAPIYTGKSNKVLALTFFYLTHAMFLNSHNCWRIVYVFRGKHLKP